MDTIMADIPLGSNGDALTESARRLSEARRGGYRIAPATLDMSNDVDAAFDVQAKVFDALADVDHHHGPPAAPARRVDGWKVAIGPKGLAVAAPLHPVLSTESAIALPWRDNTLIEVELALRLRVDLLPRSNGTYRREELLEAIDSVHLGIEIVAGRLQGEPSASFLPFLADSLGNAGYIVGERFDGTMIDDPVIEDLVVLAGSHTLFSGRARHPDGDPLVPLLAYANAQRDRLGCLKAGQIVTTGSLCGALAVTAPCDVAIVLHGREVARWAFSAMD